MKLFYFFKKKYLDFFLVFFLFILDRLSKEYIILLSEKDPNGVIFTSKYLNINLIWNKGIAFGLLSFSEEFFYNLLTMTIAAVIIMVYFLILKNKGIKKFALLLIMGGAVGNFYDRVIYFAVPDFIDLHIENFHWFIFNLADIFITTGIISMILLELFVRNRNLNETD